MASIFNITTPTDSSSPFGKVNEAKDNLYSIPKWSDSSNPGVFRATDSQIDKFWVSPDIDGARWNKNYPYQLIVVEPTSGETYQPYKSWTFTLPVGPSSLTISTPFAITGSVSLGGYIEEHNGVAIKNISITGTTGVLPLAGLNPQQSGSLAFANAILGGTVSAAQRVGNQGISVVNSFNPGVNNFKTNLVQSQEFLTNTDVSVTSGYYQFKVLEKFLENYAFLKKKSKNNLRLAFAMWKDQQVYLVQPMQFNLSRDVSSPLEYLYGLQLKAYRRIELRDSSVPETTSYVSPVDSPNEMAKVLNAIQATRTLISELDNVVRGVVADIDHVIYEPLRQLAVLAKASMGTTLSVADLPASVISGLAPALAEWASVGDGANKIAAQPFAPAKKLVDTYNNLQNLHKTGIEGAGQFNPVNKLVSEPNKNLNVFNTISISSVKLSQKQKDIIANDTQFSKGLSRVDIQNIYNGIQKASTIYSQRVGLSDPTYLATYGLESLPVIREATQDDISVLYSLNTTLIQLAKLVASKKIDHNKNYFTQVAGFAKRSGVTLTVPNSAFPVPFPFGTTLEKLALNYLGDSSRWMEIAVLNKLQEPYVDEDGIEGDFRVNPTNNTIVVSPSTNLVIGDTIEIYSNTQPKIVQKIVNVLKIGDSLNNYLCCYLADNLDLSIYKISENAKFRYYLPNTVNSKKNIYIPSSNPPAVSDQLIPQTNDFLNDQLLLVAGTDFLLREDNSLIINSQGENYWATGLANIIQGIRLALACPKGQLLGHPGYGFPVQPGKSTADLTAKEIAQVLTLMFQFDPAISSISGVKVSILGPSITIAALLKLKGASNYTPISFVLDR